MECRECGRKLHSELDFVKYDVDDNPICEDCYSDWYVECEMCGCAVYEDDVNYDVYNKNDEQIIVCEHCLKENFELCSRCKNYILKEKVLFGICDLCREEMEEENE